MEDIGMNRFLILAAWLLGLALLHATESGGRWVATWATSQQLTEKGNLPPEPGFTEATVRQKLRVSIGGEKLRVRFSNEFGNAPFTLEAAHVALADGFADARIQPQRMPLRPYTVVRLLVVTKRSPRWSAVRGAAAKAASR